MTRNDVGKKIFATCLNCMDGRVQLPTVQWIKENYQVDYIDMITEAGMDGVLTNEGTNIEGILQKINISIDKHGSNIICVVGHHDCAGNSFDDEMHKKQICMAAQRLKDVRSFCQIIGLWISDKWLVEKIIEL